MKFFIRLSLLFLVTLIGLFIARSYFWGNGKAYPVNLSLSNNDGLTKTVTRHARTSSEIQVTVDGKPTPTPYPISELTLISKMRVYLYPESNLAEEPAPQRTVELKDIHLAESNKRLEDLRKQHRHLKLQIRAAKADSNDTQNGKLGTLLAEEKLLVQDINQLVIKIHEHENF